MLSKELEIAIQVAAAEAQRRRNEFFGLEHMLYALLLDKTTVQVLRACDGDVEKLSRQLEAWLFTSLLPSVGERSREPRSSKVTA
jgi:ATP-dependent Clp protease ATP-binding subunit ClpA